MVLNLPYKLNAMYRVALYQWHAVGKNIWGSNGIPEGLGGIEHPPGKRGVRVKLCIH